MYYFHFIGEETEAHVAKMKTIFIGVYHVPAAVLGTYLCQCI